MMTKKLSPARKNLLAKRISTISTISKRNGWQLVRRFDFLYLKADRVFKCRIILYKNGNYSLIQGTVVYKHK